MCYSPLESKSSNSQPEKDSVMLIFAGQDLGMGALIHSAINAIWLAQNLGKKPYIWWEKTCLYTDTHVGGNTYSKLFQEPYQQFLNLDEQSSIYPSIWASIESGETIQSLEIKSNSLTSNNLELKVDDRDLLKVSDICVVNQYLSDDVARILVGKTNVNFDRDNFYRECYEIFLHYFQPRQHIQAAANEFWQKTFGAQQPVLGIHCRGTDKIIETALPSPHHYISALQKPDLKSKFSAFFIATDSLSALEQLQSKLTDLGIVGTQEITRSKSQLGLHFMSNGAFQNGVEMLIDMELLCRCTVILAFPGSQIFWWLNLKRAAEQHNFKLLSIQPGFFEWLRAIIFVLRVQGLRKLIQFLRMQKGGLKALLMSFLSKMLSPARKHRS